MLGRRLLPLVAFLLFCATSAGALAQDDPFASLSDAEVEVALGLLDDAESAESVGDWDAAIRAYRALAAIVEVPEAQLREAAALARGGYRADAERLFIHLCAAQSASVAEEASSALAALRSQYPARVIVRGAPVGATVTVDGGPAVAVGDGSAPLALEAGREYELTFVADGFESQIVEAAFDIDADEVLDVSMVPIEPAPALVSEADVVANNDVDPGARRWLVSASLGAVALGTGAASFIFGQQAVDRADAHNADPDGDRGDVLADQARSSRTLAWVFGGVAGASAVGAVVAAALGKPDDTAPQVGFAPSRHGWRVNVAIRW